MSTRNSRKYYDGLKSTEFITRRDIKFNPSQCSKRVAVSGRTSDGKRQFEVFGFDMGQRVKGKKFVRCVVVSIDGKYHMMEFPTADNKLALSFR